VDKAKYARVLQNMIEEAEENLTALAERMKGYENLEHLDERRAELKEAMDLEAELGGPLLANEAMTDNMAKVREAQKSLDMMIGPESDIQNIREALALLAEDKPERPKLNPEILVADIRQPGAPGKGAWKMSRKAAGDAVVAFVHNWATVEKALREALQKYGQHLSGCDWMKGWPMTPARKVCTCGLFKALAHEAPKDGSS